MLDPSAATLLDISHVSQTFAKGSGEAGPPVLKDVSLTLRTGEIVALLGRSGCGKSSLLRIISGLTRPTEGTVKLDGNPVDGPAEGVAMVFQSFALFPWLTVLDNVELGPRAIGVPLEETRKRALQAIDTIGLDGGGARRQPRPERTICLLGSANGPYLAASPGGSACRPNPVTPTRSSTPMSISATPPRSLRSRRASGTSSRRSGSGE